MVSTRRSANRTHLSPQVIIDELLSHCFSSQELKLPELKSLYYLLVHLSLDPAICYTRTGTNSNFAELKIGLHGISVPFAALCSLSDILFKILIEMFNEFFSTLHNISASFSAQDSLYFGTCATSQRLNLLLRCCLVMLKLLVLDQNRQVKTGPVLHAILAKLCYLHLNRGNEKNTVHFEKVSQEYRWDGTNFSLFTEEFVASLQFIQPIDHCHQFLCTMLEVFLDEFSLSGQLREYFRLFGSCSTSNSLFMSRTIEGHFGSVLELELVCTHFCMSFSDEQTFEIIEDELFVFQRGKSRACELCPLSALNMLLNPLLLTAPEYLQAYLISLVSESLTRVVDFESDKLLDCCLAAFERSVILYGKHTSPSDRDSFCKFSAYEGSSQPSFESYIRPAAIKQFNHLSSKLDESLQLQLKHRCLRSKNDVVAACIAHISDSNNLLNTSFQDKIKSISSSIILNAFPDKAVDNALHSGWDTKPGSIYLLASIMKLMSCSLSLATRCLMNTCDLDCSRTLTDLSTCKEHDFLIEIIGRFKNCDISLPIQKSLVTAMSSFPEKHKESKLMLIHFSSLLSLGYKSGIDVLLKGCVAIIITLMNLFVFEEGNLDALKITDGLDPFSSNLPKEKGQESMPVKRSSHVIMSKYKKVRSLCLSKSEPSGDRSISNSTPSDIDMEEETAEACNGSAFLKCVLKNCETVSDFDDLADFVECKKGKDYSDWLKNRQLYRENKWEKKAVIKWEKKKRAWKYLKANRA